MKKHEFYSVEKQSKKLLFFGCNSYAENDSKEGPYSQRRPTSNAASKQFSAISLKQANIMLLVTVKSRKRRC